MSRAWRRARGRCRGPSSHFGEAKHAAEQRLRRVSSLTHAAKAAKLAEVTGSSPATVSKDCTDGRRCRDNHVLLIASRAVSSRCMLR